jgi:hypothetical protein
MEIFQMPYLIERDNGQDLRDIRYDSCKQLKNASDLRDAISEFVTNYAQIEFKSSQ